MKYRPLLTAKSLIPVSAILIVVIVAISPRALLAPALSFNQAQESKRPKTPKNIVRIESTSASRSERSERAPKAGPAADELRELHGRPTASASGSPVPGTAFLQLTKPEYLKLYGGSPPGNRLAPPA
jgi:hypothetical protein